MLGDVNTKWKGFRVLLEALATIRSEIPNFKLSLAGGGDPSWVRNLSRELGLQDCVEPIGALPSRQSVNDFLDSLDLYIQPSFAEGLPRATIEAMSRGCPVLASSAGGIPELIQEKYRHNAGDYKMLASHLVQVLNDKEELALMARANFEHAKQYEQGILKEKLFKFWHKFSTVV